MVCHAYVCHLCVPGTLSVLAVDAPLSNRSPLLCAPCLDSRTPVTLQRDPTSPFGSPQTVLCRCLASSPWYPCRKCCAPWGGTASRACLRAVPAPLRPAAGARLAPQHPSGCPALLGPSETRLVLPATASRALQGGMVTHLASPAPAAAASARRRLALAVLWVAHPHLGSAVPRGGSVLEAVWTARPVGLVSSVHQGQRGASQRTSCSRSLAGGVIGEALASLKFV